MPKRDLAPLSGVVEDVNDRGVKVGGEWRNFSKYANGLPDFQRGQRVTLLLDGDFVMGVEGAASGGSGEREQDLAPRRIAPPAGGGAAGMERLPQDRERLIVRQSSLASAVRLGAASDPLPTSDEVLRVAAKFEAWVLREGD